MADATPQPAPEPTPNPGEQFETAARAFVPQATSLAPVPDSDHLLRAETATGAWCVRRWPTATPIARVEFVNRLLTHLRESGLTVVPAVAALAPPRGGTVLLLNGVLFDAQSWLPGEPLTRVPAVVGPNGEHVNLPGALPPAAMRELAETVARMHETTEALARTPDVPRAPLRDVAAAVGQSWQAHRERLRPVAPVTPLVQRWIRAGERALPAATARLRARPDIWLGASVVGHHDLWPAHALYRRVECQPHLSGLVDFADAAAGSPLLDLAQLVTHFAGWSADTAETVVGDYTAVRRLTPDERRALPAVAALDLVGEAGWLLDLAYARDLPLASPLTPLLRSAADAPVTSLEAVTPLAEATGDSIRRQATGVRRTTRLSRPRRPS